MNHHPARGGTSGPASVEVASPQAAPTLHLFDQVRTRIRTLHDSIRTAATYMDWVQLYLM